METWILYNSEDEFVVENTRYLKVLCTMKSQEIKKDVLENNCHVDQEVIFYLRSLY